jgi:DNA primase
MIPDETIEQVRDAADIVGLIGEAVQLKRTGADYRGSCPFHGGTHRNFAVIPRKGLYYCFVCHAGGDVFTWLMKRFGMDYPTAVRDVARRAGILIPETGPRPGPDPREPLFQALAIAQEFFARHLQESPEGSVAREYLGGREVPAEQAGEWGLGYSPRGAELLEEMQRLGIGDQVLLEAGLLHRRDDGTSAPRFRGRLVFPIHDIRGRVVGFGGRLLGPGEPKYLNSPESPVFRKGTLLYQLHLAKGAIRTSESAIVVEGYFDVLRLHAAGIENVVAPLGTALTGDQAGTLRRFAKAATLLYDSDRPGLRASFRAGDELLRHGVRVRVATLPPGEDPDSLVRKGGAAALQPLLRDAMDLVERKLQLLEQRGWLADIARRREALDRLLPTIASASDPVARDLYLGWVAERVGVSRETLVQELREMPPRRPPSVDERPPTTPAPTPASQPRRRPGARVEERVLRVLVASPAWRERAGRDLSPESFEVEAFRALFQHFVALPAAADIGELTPRLSDELLPVFAHLREAAGGIGGLDLDLEYEDALDQLLDRPEFRRASVAAPGERQRIVSQWTLERKKRYAIRRAAQRDRRSRRP